MNDRKMIGIGFLMMATWGVWSAVANYLLANFFTAYDIGTTYFSYSSLAITVIPGIILLIIGVKLVRNNRQDTPAGSQPGPSAS